MLLNIAFKCISGMCTVTFSCQVFDTMAVSNACLWQRLSMRTGKFLGYGRCHRVVHVELFVESGECLSCTQQYLHWIWPATLGWKRSSSSAWMVLPKSYWYCRLAAVKLSVECQYFYRIWFFTRKLYFTQHYAATMGSCMLSRRLQWLSAPLVKWMCFVTYYSL